MMVQTDGKHVRFKTFTTNNSLNTKRLEGFGHKLHVNILLTVFDKLAWKKLGTSGTV